MSSYQRLARNTGCAVARRYGGADAQRMSDETRELEDFDYIRDHYSFDPITNEVVNYIHYEFDDGSRMRRAFRYDWRLWSVPELREILSERDRTANLRVANAPTSFGKPPNLQWFHWIAGSRLGPVGLTRDPNLTRRERPARRLALWGRGPG